MAPSATVGCSTPFTRAESLFRELDGCEIHVGTSRHVAYVFDFHVDDDEAWVQLLLVGQPSSELVLHLSSGATMCGVVAALRAWLMTRPSNRLHVVNVQWPESGAGVSRTVPIASYPIPLDDSHPREPS